MPCDRQAPGRQPQRADQAPAQAARAPAAGRLPGTLPGRGTGKPGDTAGTGSGIASPLTEQPAKTIEVVKTIAITGGDGEVDLAQMTDVTFLDADGREVRMILKPDDRPLPVPPAVP